MKIQSFDFSIDILKVLLWRHSQAENLQALLQDKQDAIDELNKDFWNQWIVDIFNLDTANDFGLSVWSAVLDLPITLDGSTDDTINSNFGFGSFRKNFNNGSFTTADGTVILTTEEARLALKLRYYQLVTRATVPECNKIVADVFEGIVYVIDGLNMVIGYVFEETPSAGVRLILDNYDLLPRPSGVKVNYIYSPGSSFGFGGFRKNFENGNYRR